MQDNNNHSPMPERVDPSEWVEQYGDYLYRYAYSRLRDGTAAEDVVQETFVAGIRHHHQFSGKGSERGWLLGILKRKIIDHVRKRTRQERVGSFEDEHDPTNLLFDVNGQWKKNAIPDESPDRDMQATELTGIVQDCLTNLPKGQANVFVLSVMEEMASEEICRELDITPQKPLGATASRSFGIGEVRGSQMVSGGDATTCQVTNAPVIEMPPNSFRVRMMARCNLMNSCN